MSWVGVPPVNRSADRRAGHGSCFGRREDGERVEIRLTYKRRGMVVAAALAFLLLGLGLLLTTWQGLRQQRELTERHLEVMARALLRGAEGGVVRGLRAQDGPGRGMTPGAQGFLNEVFESGDVVFVGLFNDAGKPIWTASQGRRTAESPDENAVAVSPPGQRPAWVSELADDFWTGLRRQGEDQAVLDGQTGPILAYGVQARPALSRLCRMLGPA